MINPSLSCDLAVVPMRNYCKEKFDLQKQVYDSVIENHDEVMDLSTSLKVSLLFCFIDLLTNI